MTDITITWNDTAEIQKIKDKIAGWTLSEKDKAYYERIIRVLNMPNLSTIPGNPVN